MNFSVTGTTLCLPCAGNNWILYFDANPKHIDRSRLLGSSQIMDSYLLALARAHGGQLATFDNRLVVDAVRGGRAALHLIA